MSTSTDSLSSLLQNLSLDAADSIINSGENTNQIPRGLHYNSTDNIATIVRLNNYAITPKKRNPRDVASSLPSLTIDTLDLLSRRSSSIMDSSCSFYSRSFDDFFLLGKVIAYGSECVVYGAKRKDELDSNNDNDHNSIDDTNNDDEYEYAVKIVNMSQLEQHPALKREIFILKELSHPNIICLVDFFVDFETESVFIVMEKAGPELFDVFLGNESPFSESQAKNIVSQLVSALFYLHENFVCHRDIKFENILCASLEEVSVGKNLDEINVKLADFGISKMFELIAPMSSPKMGTLGYRAPEQFKSEGYRHSIDMWSLGVVTYILLCGYPPFRSKEYSSVADAMTVPFWISFNTSDHYLIQQILEAEVEFPHTPWSSISKEAKDFIYRLLEKDPIKRMNASEALNHEWLHK